MSTTRPRDGESAVHGQWPGYSARAIDIGREVDGIRLALPCPTVTSIKETVACMWPYRSAECRRFPSDIPPDNSPSLLHGVGHFPPSTTTIRQSTYS